MLSRSVHLFIPFLLLALLAGCASTTQTAGGASGSPEYGLASFYADKYQGRRTANGERFDQAAATASHRTLAFGQRVKVTNTDNGRSVEVRINDRGPFVKGRVIDLSSSSFAEIADPAKGLVPVKVELLVD